MKKEKIWRCDLKEPCIKFCESEHNKHQCGIYLKDKKLKEEKNGRRKNRNKINN